MNFIFLKIYTSHLTYESSTFLKARKFDASRCVWSELSRAKLGVGRKGGITGLRVSVDIVE